MAKTVELRKGLVRFYYRITSVNGNILLTSQKYFSQSNARRAAKKMAHDLKVKYIESI